MRWSYPAALAALVALASWPAWAQVGPPPAPSELPGVEPEPEPAADEPEPAADEPEPAADEPEPAADEPEPAPAADDEPEPPRGWFARVLGIPGAIDSSGELSFEARAFLDDDDPRSVDSGLALLGRLEWRHRHGRLDEKLRVFGRVDRQDAGRSVLLVEEAYLQYRRGRLRLKAGADLVNWTATEAFHPADVINARNLDSDLENLEKIGEPMVAVQLGLTERTTVQALFMPVFTRTRFPAPASRLNLGPPGTDLGDRRALFDRDGVHTEADFGPQAALRLQQTVGQADLSVHLLEHMDRLQPLIAVNPMGELVPVFQTVRQLGGTYQHDVAAGLLTKVEAAYRWFARPDDPLAAAADAGLAFPGEPFPDRDHLTVAVGLEYGRPHESGASSTFLLEGQAILGVPDGLRRALSPFQRDVLVAYRFAMDDEDGKELVAGLIADLEHLDERLINLSYQQRLGETFTVRLGLRLFAADPAPVPTGLVALRRADHVRLTVSRHF
jgi:hypothetical protein